LQSDILILGGGPGGLVAANTLARELAGRARITLVDKSAYHTFLPSLLWVMTGHREPGDIKRPLALLERKGVRFVQGEVSSIEPEKSLVRLAGGRELKFDYLIVALGSQPRPDKLPGGDRACAPWTEEGAVRCRETLKRFRGGTIMVGPHSWPYKCPPAPFEVAFMVSYILEQRGVRGKSRIGVFHQWKRPMEPFGPTMSGAFERLMSQYGIDFIGGVELERVDDKGLVARDGERIEADLPIVVPPHEPPRPVSSSSLASEETGGYMLVDKRTLRHPDYGNVFGVGDVIAPTLGIGMAGVFAHFQAEFVASQIIDELKGAFMGEHYNMSGVCVLDMGYIGAAVYCDFSGKITGESEFPDCVMLGGMRLFRAVKLAFEKYWLSRWF
jgi:sulfide:quinone oxidoreductase